MNENSSSEETRRAILTQMGLGLVAITVSSAWGQVGPAEARGKGAGLRTLTEGEGKTLEALGEVLLPGAAEAGVAHYVDDQLSSGTPLLMLKYVDYPGPFLDFYRKGLRSLEALSQARHGRPFRDLSSVAQTDVVREISAKNPKGWDGPPAPLFYFVTRSDSLDVVYGTQAGFGRLQIPYMAHIAPARKW